MTWLNFIVKNIFRSSRPEVFCNFAKFTEKHLCQSLFFNKVAVLRPGTLLKKKLWHRCFPVKFTKFLTLFLTEHLWWLLLNSHWNWILAFSWQFTKKTSDLLWSMMRKMFIEVRLCNLTTYVLKGMTKSLKHTWWRLIYQF